MPVYFFRSIAPIPLATNRIWVRIDPRSHIRCDRLRDWILHLQDQAMLTAARDLDLTACLFSRQTAKLCGVRLDFPAAVLLDDSPA